MQRKKWYHDALNGRLLQEVASDLHGLIHGSIDASSDQIRMNANIIQHALDTWTKECGRSVHYDICVRNLLETVIGEFIDWSIEQNKRK